MNRGVTPPDPRQIPGELKEPAMDAGQPPWAAVMRCARCGTPLRDHGPACRDQHKALHWVEQHYPDVSGAYKAALILAYGAGLDAGFAEAQQIIAGIAAGAPDG